MKNEKITGGFKKLKKDLAGMTFKEKVEHIWTYYRSWVIVACAVLVVISIFVTSFINLTTKTVSAGASINVLFQEGAEDYLVSNLEKQLKTGVGRESVQFKTDFTDPDSVENNYYMMEGMYSLVASKDLDYMILDATGMDMMTARENVFMYLDEFFTPEELAELNTIPEQTSGRPLMVDISDWPVVRQNPENPKQYFFVVIANTPRKEATRVAFDLLRDYGTK